MTNVYREKSRNGWRLETYILGVRRKLWIGNCSKSAADTFAANIHELKMAAQLNVDPDKSTINWANELDDPRIINKLAEWGLVEKRGETARTKTLSSLCQEHIDRNSDWSEPHRVWMVRCKDQMIDLLGDITLDKLTEWHAKQFRDATQKRYSQATFAKQIQRAKQLLSDGESRFFDRNPFDRIKVSSSVNKERQVYVSKETIDKIMPYLSTDMQWVVAMARYAGVRIPSEVAALAWTEIDWKSKRMTVTAPKQKRYVDKYKRVVPIFPELRPYLEAMPRNASTVLNWQGGKSLGMLFRNRLESAIKKAGLEKWERIFVSLRASCRTDLLRIHPEHVVNAWLGHDGKIGAKHYNRITEEDFQRATAPTVAPTKTKTPNKSKQSSAKE